MSPSIRTYLLINLLLSVTLITSLAIIGNLFLAHRDIQTQLDLQLIRTSLQIKDFFSDGIKDRRLNVVQNNIQQALDPNLNQQNYSARLKNALTEYRHRTAFQIWDKHGHLILHSKGAPRIPLSDGNVGLSTLWLDDNSWRVDTIYDKGNDLTIMVGERSDFRQKLENQLTQDSILIMLVTYPFLGFLIWIIVGRGLDSLKKIATELSERKPSYLEPVDLEGIPTEIEPLIIELNHLFSRLKDAFQREKRFAADAAHELKTPLAALSTQAQVAIRTKDDKAREEALHKVLAGVNRSTHVVQQLLTLSRMVPEASINEPETIDLFKQVADVTARLANQAIEKNIEISLDANENEHYFIIGNTTAISILVRNIIDNAIRYTDANGTVTIQLEKTPKKIIFNVIDDGPGIPQELRERVFERFYRIMGTKAMGSGLGLGIVQQIAKLHNAEINLNTPVSGKGLEFQVVFPRHL